jgi:tRNA(Ile)-lysidine synthase
LVRQGVPGRLKRRADTSGPENAWRRAAAALGEVLPVERLHSRAWERIVETPLGEVVGVACSGGADSVALVLLLWIHLPKKRGDLRVLHFDHALRGAESDADAAFVRALARRLGLRCVSETWMRSGAAAKTSEVSEAAARDARMGFFRQVLGASGGRTLVLGHQMDDVAETMLMRLGRGSGAGGLAAPRPVQSHRDGITRVRPLLRIRAAELREALRAAGAHWREDASNATDRYLRNRVRRAVIPIWKEAAEGDVVRGCAAAREQLEEDDDALEAWLHRLLGERADACASGDFRILRGEAAALARRAVQAWVQWHGLAEVLAVESVRRLVRVVQDGTALRLAAGTGRFVVVESGRIELVEKRVSRASDAPSVGWSPCELPLGKTARNPSGDFVTARRIRASARLIGRLERGEVDPSREALLALPAEPKPCFSLRSRRPGDRYRMLGSAGRKLLQDALVDRKVPRELRDRLPVCTLDGAIVWVPGLPPAADFAIQRGAKTVVQLTYRRAGANVAASTPHQILSCPNPRNESHARP